MSGANMWAWPNPCARAGLSYCGGDGRGRGRGWSRRPWAVWSLDLFFFLWKRGRRREREPIGSGADVQLVWVDEGKIVEGHTRRQGAGREGLARRGAISLALTMTSGSSGLFSCKEEIHLLNCQY